MGNKDNNRDGFQTRPYVIHRGRAWPDRMAHTARL